MSPSSSTPSTGSLFRLGLDAILPTSEEVTTSRVVVDNEILRTVISTFDAGQVLTEHSLPRAMTVTFLEDEMDFFIDGCTEQIGTGDVIYLAPDNRHVLTVVTPCHMQLVMANVDKAATASEKQPGNGQPPIDREPSD